MPTTSSFGDWLRQRRRALGLTHAALASVVHCSVSALRKIEQDERRPSRHLAERLANGLQVSDRDRARFLEIARGERRVDQLGALAPVSPPALPPMAIDPAADTARPLHRLFTPFDASMPSIAVLPFANLSDDASNEHFADGLAEELLNVLAKIPGLRVASRTSAFSFKGRGVDVPTAARQLNVASILEGSVRRAGPRVRVTAQLVRADTDSHLWSQTYDRDVQDAFAVQDDIAQTVVKELRKTLLGEAADAAAEVRLRGQLEAASRGRTANAKAYQLYLQARFLIDRMNREDINTSIGYCRQALEIDPGYALAWAGLAGAHSVQAHWGWEPLGETFERAREAAHHALQLEPALAEAHAELGWIRMTYDCDWRGAEASYRRALALGAGNASIVVGASLLADNLGRQIEAVALARRAVEVDPLSFIAQGNLALRCFNAGLLDEADRAIDAALAITRRVALLHWLRGTILLEQGRLDDALTAFEQEDNESLRLQGLVMAHHAAARPAQAQAVLDQLIKVGADDSAFQIAEVYAYRGEADPAFEWLERARRQRDPGVSQIQSGPLLRSRLRGDPRWRTFLETMGFAEFLDEAD